MSKVKNEGEVYRCNICGNVVKVIEVGGGELVCCGKPMRQIKENDDLIINDEELGQIIIKPEK